MASVWLARLVGKHGFEKLVAVKTILPDRAEDPHFRRMFLDEARIASGIDHANVAHILDLGEQEDLLYLVMEWIDGDSLSKLHRAAEKRGRRIPLGVVLRVLADASSGLHAAHELKDASGRSLSVVHRDVSPQNILVSSQGNAKLIDFGIAKAVDRLTQTIASSGPSLKGKIGYMAPEQAMGQDLDRRTDVWALGAVLYFLLSGAAPFAGPNDVATLYELTRGKPAPPLPAHVPDPVHALVTQLLAHDPAARPQTASDVQRRLEQLMVTCGALTTTADVARYVEEQLAERADARRKAVSMALEAAKDRVKIGGLVGEGPEVSTATVPRPLARPLPELSPGNSDPRHLTSATLGSAAVVYAKTGPTAADTATKRMWAAVAGVAAALGLLVVFTVVTAFVRNGSTSGAAAPAPPASDVTPGPTTASPVVPLPPVTGVIGGTTPAAPDVAPSATASASASAVVPPAIVHPATKPAAATTTKQRTSGPSSGGTTKKGAVDDGF